MFREPTEPTRSEETPEVAGEPTSLRWARVAGPGDKGVAILIPLASWKVVAKDRRISFRLIIETEGQVAFDKALQRLRDMRRRLIIVDNTFESIHCGQVLTTFYIVTSDFHFLSRQMVASKIKF